MIANEEEEDDDVRHHHHQQQQQQQQHRHRVGEAKSSSSSSSSSSASSSSSSSRQPRLLSPPHRHVSTQRVIPEESSQANSDELVASGRASPRARPHIDSVEPVASSSSSSYSIGNIPPPPPPTATTADHTAPAVYGGVTAPLAGVPINSYAPRPMMTVQVVVLPFFDCSYVSHLRAQDLEASLPGLSVRHTLGLCL